MYRLESIDLGTYRGDDYVLVGFVEPEPGETEHYDPSRDAENYGVTLVRTGTNPLEENVELIRMDTAHDRPHLDLAYLPSDTDEQRKIWLEDGYSYDRMKQYVLTNWKTFADRYIRHDE